MKGVLLVAVAALLAASVSAVDMEASRKAEGIIDTIASGVGGALDAASSIAGGLANARTVSMKEGASPRQAGRRWGPGTWPDARCHRLRGL